MGSLALGPGNALTSIDIAPEDVPAAITIECERMPAAGGNPAGGPDSEGLDLHCLWEGRRAPLEGARSDDARAVLRVEFDATAEIVLPTCGRLSLVGGTGLYRVSLSRPRKAPSYQREWRALTRLLVRATTFRVPSGHTVIGAHNAGIIVTADGAQMALDGSLKAICAGTVVTGGLVDTRLFTACLF